MKLWPQGRWARAGLVAGLVLVLLVVADRATARIAGSKVASEMAAGIRCVTGAAVSPSVSFSGFPFLAELAGNTFPSIRISADDLKIVPADGADGADGPLSLQSLAIVADDVSAPRGDRPGRIGTLTASATVPWSVLPSSAAGHRLRYGATSDGRLTISTTTKVSVIPVPVTVIAAVHLQGTTISVQPEDIRVLGVSKSIADLDSGLGQWLSRGAASSMGAGSGGTGSAGTGSGSGGTGAGSGSSGAGGMETVTQKELPALPAGMAYSAATVGDAGLTITMTGHNLDASKLETKNCVS